MLMTIMAALFVMGIVFLAVIIIDYNGKIFLFYEDVIEEFDRHKEWKENREKKK